MQVCTSLQTNNHASAPPLSFLQAGCPSPPNQQRQSTEGTLQLLYFNGTVCGNTTTIQNTGLTDQLQPRNDAVAVIDVFTRQATNMLVELEIFHADVALQTWICTENTNRLVTAITAQSKKNTGHLTGLQKPISLGIIVSQQHSKSSDVGIYRAGTLLPEIIVTLFTQKHISHCYVRQLRTSEHTTLSYSRQKPTGVYIFFNGENMLYFKSKRINATENSNK